GAFSGLGLKIDVVGEENIPLVGGAILAINHTSYLDFALGGIPANRRGRRLVRFMAKDSIFRHKIAGPLMRGMKHISVDRDAGSQAFRDSVAALKSGEIVGVFPEATMSRSLDIKGIKSGTIRMARVAKVPVLPMIIFGGHRILSYGVKDFTRGRCAIIMVGEPLDIDGDPEEGNYRLREALRELLVQAVERYPDKVLGASWLPARLGGSAPTLEEAEVIEVAAQLERAAKRAQKKS
ncbi:1-acyl-sn-glycerol-3-phosphate acyltransferase, partial [bacterium]|nr:1-acyl-sn-glycerol-3-phosphate acyltransferase [bacterium]